MGLGKINNLDKFPYGPLKDGESLENVNISPEGLAEILGHSLRELSVYQPPHSQDREELEAIAERCKRALIAKGKTSLAVNVLDQFTPRPQLPPSFKRIAS